jgi:putative Mn2+ efflux pump MntP
MNFKLAFCLLVLLGCMLITNAFPSSFFINPESIGRDMARWTGQIGQASGMSYDQRRFLRQFGAFARW